MPTATAPNHLSARQGVAAWLGVMGPPHPASTMEDQLVASLPQGGFFIFVAAKELAVSWQLQRRLGRWREPGEGKERVCRLMSNHNNSPSVSPSD